MRFQIYESEWNERRHIAWIGKYTYGCCHIRGISINLFHKYGEILTTDCSYTPKDKEPNENTDLSVLVDYAFRNDYSSFRMHEFSDICSMLDSFHPTSDENYDLFLENWLKICSYDKKEYLYSKFYDSVLILKITRDELINEIKEVEKLCFDNNITVNWV